MRELCDVLFQFGAFVTLQDQNGETPLQFAASCDTIIGTEWLLQHDADMETLDAKNRARLHEAAYGAHSSNV